MQGSRPGGASATARRAYRAVLPLGLRRSLRDRLSSLAPGLVPARRPKRDPSVRRFDLPLPRLPGASAAPPRRDSLRIEAPRRLWIAGELHRGGVAAYEPATTSVMLGLTDHLQPDVVFDVGANIGPNSLLIPAILDVPVVAFEPDPNVAAALSRVVELNDLRCTVEASAVGERDEMATLFISPSDPSTSLRAGFREATGETIVPVRSLDSYVRGTGQRPRLLKIDTETTEPAVFRGATELLTSRPWIVCEILPGWTETEVESLLLPLGYQAFQIVDTWPLPRRASLAGHASFEDANWLFAPETPTTELWDAIERWRRAIDACEPPRRKSSTASPASPASAT